MLERVGRRRADRPGWHRDLGATLLVAVLAHLSLIVVGYADRGRSRSLAEVGALLRDYEDMVSAFVAAGIMVLVGVHAASGRSARALPYELWHHLHLTSYLVLLLGFGHQFSNGAQLFQPGPVRTGWIALLPAGRSPPCSGAGWSRRCAFNLRHRLRVADVVAESPDTISIYLTGRAARPARPARRAVLPLAVPHPGLLVAVAPVLALRRRERPLAAAHRQGGRHGTPPTCATCDPGTRVWAEGPSGTFTAAHRTRERALLIAGGSGIAPLRAMLEELPPGAALIYRARTPADVLLHRELDWLAQERGRPPSGTSSAPATTPAPAR